MVANHPRCNQSAQRNGAVWDGYESFHHGQKRQDSKMRVNDQVEVQKREILVKLGRHESKMYNQTPARTCPKLIHKGQQTAHSVGDSSCPALDCKKQKYHLRHPNSKQRLRCRSQYHVLFSSSVARQKAQHHTNGYTQKQLRDETRSTQFQQKTAKSEL